MKPLCSNCEKRPAVYHRSKKGQRRKRDKQHDLCRECQQAQMDSSRHGMPRMAGPGIERIAGRWAEFVHTSVPPLCRAYTWGACRVFVGKEPAGWHLSISCESRYPTWEEIKAARYDLVPNEVTMAMILPPKQEYVNIHPNCFHLYEIEGERLIIA